MEPSIVCAVNIFWSIGPVCRKEWDPVVIEKLIQDKTQGVNIDSVVIGAATMREQSNQLHIAKAENRRYVTA